MLQRKCTLQFCIVATHRLSPGDTVFIRWHGDAEFELIEKIDHFIFPHWTCRRKEAEEEEIWIIPQIHISSKDLQSIAGDHNYKQLSIIEQVK